MNKGDLGKLGVWSSVDNLNFTDAATFAANAEAQGYGAIWIPEAVGRDPFVVLSVLAQATTSLKLCTGIANIYARDAMAMNAARQSLDDLSDGRLVLGLGVSHSEIVGSLRKHDYQKPLTAMRNYLSDMSEAVYLGNPPRQTGLVVLAALREKMLGLAARVASGAHPYFVTPEHTAKARAIMGPESLLAPEQKVLLVKDAGEARRIARQTMSTYLGLQNYRNNLLTLGFTEADFEHGGSDRLVDAIVVWGDESAIMKRVEEHWRNGADHVCIQALRPDGEPGSDEICLAALAPA